MDPLDLIRAGRIRRFFRATQKLNVPNLVSHITQRAAGKEPLFLEDSDYLTMLGLMKEIAEKYSLKLYAFCLMPNHLHLLLSPREPNLYDAMRSLFSRYAMRFNRKYERKGHLFSGPYRQAVCLDDRYLLAASLYIHQNPVRAGLTTAPLDYRWSSCRLYCQDRASSSFLDSDFILGLFPEEESSRKRRYKMLLERGCRLYSGHVLEQENAIECFCSQLGVMFPSFFRIIAKEKYLARFSGIELPDIKELEAQAATLCEGQLQGRPKSNRAKKHLIEQLISRGYKRREIAQRLGISRKTVYNILKSVS